MNIAQIEFVVLRLRRKEWSNPRTIMLVVPPIASLKFHAEL